MIKLKKWMTNPCEECTHVLSDETGEAVIVDCGVYYPNERRHLLEYIEAEHLHPVRLLLTHAHHDHVYCVTVKTRTCLSSKERTGKFAVPFVLSS